MGLAVGKTVSGAWENCGSRVIEIRVGGVAEPGSHQETADRPGVDRRGGGYRAGNVQ